MKVFCVHLEAICFESTVWWVLPYGINLGIYLLKCLRKSSAMAFPRPLKFGIFCIFWQGMPLDPFSLGRPRRSIHPSCAYTSKSHAMPLKVRVFHLAISRRANGTSMLVVRRENSPIQSCSFRLVISENTGASSVLKLLYNIPVVHLKKLYLLLVMSHENKKAYINDGSENINLKWG